MENNINKLKIDKKHTSYDEKVTYGKYIYIKSGNVVLYLHKNGLDFTTNFNEAVEYCVDCEEQELQKVIDELNKYWKCDAQIVTAVHGVFIKYN